MILESFPAMFCFIMPWYASPDQWIFEMRLNPNVRGQYISQTQRGLSHYPVVILIHSGSWHKELNMQVFLHICRIFVCMCVFVDGGANGAFRLNCVLQFVYKLSKLVMI